jgi:hypothetical protein
MTVHSMRLHTLGEKFRSVAIIGSTAAGLCFTALLSSPVRAAALPQGLIVSPAIEQLAVASGQQQVTFSSTVTNNTASAVTLSLSAQDFSSLGVRSGSLNFVSGRSPDNSHGLAAWMDVGAIHLMLAPGSSQTVPITVAHTDRLAPGGHYAALLFKVAAPAGAPGNRITANEVVSTLVFLTASGHEVNAVHLESIGQRPWATQIPSSVDIVFKNTGNTQTAPRGLVTVFGPAHREVARGAINTDSGLVLPGTSRVFSVPLRLERFFSLPGPYTMLVSYHADGVDNVTVYKKTILLVKVPLLIGLSVLLLAGVVWLIRRTEPFKKYILNR